MGLSAPSISRVRPLLGPVAGLRDLAIRGLARMYRPEEGLFAFRVRRTREALVLEGSSLRYTAIALIGLAGEEEAVQAFVLGGAGLRDACARLVGEVARGENLGDVALVLWAACAAGYPDRRSVTERLLALRPDEAAHPTVEIAWTLAALCAESDAPPAPLRDRLVRRLIAAFEPRSGMFPHDLGGRPGGFRGHVCCFADLVYPAYALARYAELCGDAKALDVALRCAGQICGRQGPEGQWWWHYDRRTG